jgi:hypothetical protein
MKSIKSTLLAMAVGTIGFAALSISADESVERNVMVQIHKLSDSNSKVDLNVDGNAEVFSLPDLEVGETKEITTEAGNLVSVTKTESGVTVNINGKEVNLPRIGGDMSAHFLKDAVPLHTKVKRNGIQVIGDLTDEQIAIVRDAFLAAGVDKEVNFTKGHEMQFISINGDDNKHYEFEFDGDANSWTSEDGKHIQVIKMGDGNGEGKLHLESKVLIIEESEEGNN